MGVDPIKQRGELVRFRLLGVEPPHAQEDPLDVRGRVPRREPGDNAASKLGRRDLNEGDRQLVGRDRHATPEHGDVHAQDFVPAMLVLEVGRGDRACTNLQFHRVIDESIPPAAVRQITRLQRETFDGIDHRARSQARSFVGVDSQRGERGRVRVGDERQLGGQKCIQQFGRRLPMAWVALGVFGEVAPVEDRRSERTRASARDELDVVVPGTQIDLATYHEAEDTRGVG